jgi:tetratricopeptide (TPR) repeat protein
MAEPQDPRTEALAHRAAADAAFAATQWQDAVAEYEAALSLATAEGNPALDEAEILTRLGSAYWSMSEARTGWRTLRRAMSLYRDRGDALGFARATVEVLRIWGPWERQLAMSNEALEMLGGDDLDAERAYLRARLLMATSWRGRDERWNEAIAIGEKHGFADIVASKVEDASWRSYRNGGPIDEWVGLALEAHQAYASVGAHEPACGCLRSCSFSLLECGDLDRGAEMARRCIEYARGKHLKFHEELALTDLAGEAFARADYDRCVAVLDELMTNTDFRADLYRMWIVERSGDTKRAVQMMVDPERAGRAATGMSQTHGAAAGVLYRAGIEEPAKRELEQWAEIAEHGHDLAIEAPVLFECIAALGSDELVRKTCNAYEAHDADGPRIPVFATLSGRAVAPAHGALLVRLGRLDDAERVYRDGLHWCERERVPVDAGLCLAGLADVSAARGDDEMAADYRSQARGLFEAHGAALYLPRVS